MEQSGVKQDKESLNKMVLECLGATVQPTATFAASMINPIAGAVVAAFFAAQDTYKYNRAAKNAERALERLHAKKASDEILLNDTNEEVAKEQLLPLFWDYVMEEQEVDKINLFVNGVVSSVRQEEINMEKIFIYFDILKSLRMKEIHHFIDVFVNKNYKVVSDGWDVTYPEGFDIAYHRYALNKLERLGLIHNSVMDANGTLDANYEITHLGEDLNAYFIQIAK